MHLKQIAALSPHCQTEYNRLTDVLLCSPKYMKIREVINETQKVYVKENINTSQAVAQHERLLHTLTKYNVQFHLIKPEPQFPEQVFTRDIGFVIGEHVFISNMKQTIRKDEIIPLQNWLHQCELHAISLQNGFIEGGDVLIDVNKVWIGASDRTSAAGAAEVQKYLPNYEIHYITFDESYLHLDCVFNPISSHKALIFPSAFPNDVLTLLEHHYEFIEVCEKEQFTLGTNVLSLGDKKVVSLPVNENVNRQLEENGYEVICVDISEIIKSGGSFRCITLPLKRRAAN